MAGDEGIVQGLAGEGRVFRLGIGADVAIGQDGRVFEEGDVGSAELLCNSGGKQAGHEEEGNQAWSSWQWSLLLSHPCLTMFENGEWEMGG